WASDMWWTRPRPPRSSAGGRGPWTSRCSTPPAASSRWTASGQAVGDRAGRWLAQTNASVRCWSPLRLGTRSALPSGVKCQTSAHRVSTSSALRGAGQRVVAGDRPLDVVGRHIPDAFQVVRGVGGEETVDGFDLGVGHAARVVGTPGAGPLPVRGLAHGRGALLGPCIEMSGSGYQKRFGRMPAKTCTRSGSAGRTAATPPSGSSSLLDPDISGLAPGDDGPIALGALQV